MKDIKEQPEQDISGKATGSYIYDKESGRMVKVSDEVPGLKKKARRDCCSSDHDGHHCCGDCCCH